MPCVSQNRHSKSFLTIPFLVLALLFVWTSVALADRGHDRDRDRDEDSEPEIFAVTVNNQDQEIKIIGEHFGTDIHDVKVTLATFGQLTVKAVMDTTMIIAQFPALSSVGLTESEEQLPPGDYVLTVEVDGEDEDYGLTIGAVGPQGPAGTDGVDGTNGIDGDPGKNGVDGTNGQNGSSCSINGTVVSCTDGTYNDVKGPQGDSGPPILAQPMVQTISTNFGSNSVDLKTVTAKCPVGEVVVGGGFNLSVTNSSADALKSIIVKTSNPSIDTVETPSGPVNVDAWTVIAEEHTLTGLDWDIFAFARCMAPHEHKLL